MTNASDESRLLGPPALVEAIPEKERPSVVVISTDPGAAAAATTSFHSSNSNFSANSITEPRLIEV